LKTEMVDETTRLNKDEEYLTPEQFSEKFDDMTVEYATMLCRTSQIERLQIGRRYWIPLSALGKFLNANV